MKKKLFLLLSCVFICPLFVGCNTLSTNVQTTPIQPTSQQPLASVDYKSGVILVKFDISITTKESAEKVVDIHGLSLTRYNKPLRLGVVSVPNGEEQYYLQLLEADVNFEYVELDYSSKYVF